MTSRLRRATSCVPLMLAASLALAAPTGTPTLGVDDLHPGQKAVVRTVFSGERVEEFEAEVVGVLRGGRTEGDLILAKATSERVVKSGVAQGMSGSPVYVDGRLIGALSTGWSFSREPLFGVTPISEMLAVLRLPARADTSGSAGPSGVERGRGSIRFGEYRWGDGAGEPIEDASPSWTRNATLPLGVPLACSGMHPTALAEARRLLGPMGLAVTPGGRAASGGPPADSLRPGSAVAVDIMTGDLEVSAIGTLSWREGNRVLIFGHPLFQAGDVRLPLSSAEIVTIVASDLSSFKLGVRGRPVGTLTQDRRTAMSGTLGGTPRLLPVVVEVAAEGLPTRRFRFASIEDRALAPVLIGLASLNSLLESGGGGGDQTLRWSLRLARRGSPTLTLRDVVTGDSPFTDVMAAVAAPLRFLFNSPYSAVRLDSVTVAIEATPRRAEWMLHSARVLDAAVRPGGSLRIECELDRWHGARSRVSLTVPVPEEIPDGRCVLWLGGGSELSRYEATRLPGRYRPSSLEDAWRRLAERRSTDALYAALFVGSPEVTREERDYPELPASALALLASGQNAGDGARSGDAARFGEQHVSFSGTVRGELLLSIQVDSKAP